MKQPISKHDTHEITSTVLSRIANLSPRAKNAVLAAMTLLSLHLTSCDDQASSQEEQAHMIAAHDAKIDSLILRQAELAEGSGQKSGILIPRLQSVQSEEQTDTLEQYIDQAVVKEIEKGYWERTSIPWRKKQNERIEGVRLLNQEDILLPGRDGNQELRELVDEKPEYVRIKIDGKVIAIGHAGGKGELYYSVDGKTFYAFSWNGYRYILKDIADAQTMQQVQTLD